ncbi:aminotransferase class V-fold PLP-dependent enzyme [Rhizobiales bacterium RZME27]|jgi:cysteine desulfurase/selenocysteine lyase|uniref:Aminotransferase class V-fold PLP-dependent enzyme n=1 Tax=Endobacterium cereale TaxID=2663029 RepID=A0A6A8ALS5_9HYPH|nr:aminotransferase class V-fold PLP-dependent enzyme [Endobacterium cereale]MQY50106.1 aminotransferase class V-fold PLP-dependent enzyme [Endobacterium cereale]
MHEELISQLRSDIPYIHDKIYVDNASVTPIPKRVQVASEHYNRIVSEKLREYRVASLPFFDKGRALAAKLVGSRPDNIAYVQNTAHGLSLVALGIDWRPGDNIVVCAEDFPSNFLCWVQLGELGVDVRQVGSRTGRIDVSDVREVIDSRTRVVSVSHVQFYSGFRVDVAALGEICAASGALLVVDGTQSTGAIKLDVGAAGVDVLVVSAHKWMMGPRGIGFASFSERALAAITPRVVGWLSVNDPFAFNRKLDFLPDARRFEPGTANGSGILGLVERLAQIDELGIDWIEERVLWLSTVLRERARQEGLELVYDFDGKTGSGINLLRRPGTPTLETHANLTANGIFASIRNDAIRISPHYYNTPDEIERIVTVMSSDRPGLA